MHHIPHTTSHTQTAHTWECRSWWAGAAARRWCSACGACRTGGRWAAPSGGGSCPRWPGQARGGARAAASSRAAARARGRRAARPSRAAPSTPAPPPPCCTGTLLAHAETEGKHPSGPSIGNKLWLVGCYTSWQHARSYQGGYRLVTVHTYGNFIVVSHWWTKPPAPWSVWYPTPSHIILTPSQSVLAIS